MRPSCILLLGILTLGISQKANAICGLDDAATEMVRLVKNPEVRADLNQKLAGVGCTVCHLARFGGPRNAFGTAVNTLLSLKDREDSFRQRDAGRRMASILVDPSLPGSPTFGDLFQNGRLPVQPLTSDPDPLPHAPPAESENLTVEDAMRLVRETHAKSPWEILQLSKCHELSPPAAAALADFSGEMLILGLKNLTPDVASALANAKAATVWLPSLTSLSPEVAASLAKMPAHLVLTGLTALDSIPLAEKLASSPGALSFPYLKNLSPEIATVLARSRKSLTLAGLTSVPSDVLDKLARSPGTLYLPNLLSIEGTAIAAKLASGSVVLPKLEKLSAEHAALFPSAKGVASFFGGIVLPLSAITPEVAAAFAPDPNAPTAPFFNLTLVGTGPVSDEAFKALLRSRAGLILPNIESLSPTQKRILSDAATEQKSQPSLPAIASLSLPSAKVLDSLILAERSVATGNNGTLFSQGNRGIVSISDEVAAALGALPDTVQKLSNGSETILPNGNLSFPSLTSLPPVTLQLLLRKRWLDISLPSLDNISPETIRSLARNTFRLTLGITSLPEASADAFAETPTDQSMGGGFIVLPKLRNLSPKAARILVNSLNRGIENLGYTRISKSPKLYLGGDFGSSGAGFTALDPDVASELARYQGYLSISGLEELPDASAAALSSFAGTYLSLSGPAVEKLSQPAAAYLSRIPGTLQLPLKDLDSGPLAEKFAQQTNWTLFALETISTDAAIALTKYKYFFSLRKLRILDSPDLARRYVSDKSSGGITLPMLESITPETAAIIANSNKPLFLGLTLLDSTEVAAALAKSQQSVELPRLRAATPEVIRILTTSGRFKLSADPPFPLPTQSN